MNNSLEQYKNLIDEIKFCGRITFRDKFFIFIGNFTTSERNRNYDISRLRGKITKKLEKADICVVGFSLQEGDNYERSIADLQTAMDLEERCRKPLIISESIFNKNIKDAFEEKFLWEALDNQRLD